MLRPELENRRLQIKENLARRLPPAPLDAGQIKQVLVNLIKNAMQAMTAGGVLTAANRRHRRRRVGERLRHRGRHCAGQDQSIFEPFYTTKKKGTGLGLMIVQRIVRQHGGRIELESRVGQGTTFRVRLPCRARAPKLEATKLTRDEPRN